MISSIKTAAVILPDLSRTGILTMLIATTTSDVQWYFQTMHLRKLESIQASFPAGKISISY
ncbi:hypothetical protein ASD32_10880 [Rhizobium sp. Root483D2]|nr:hypothetical protein ASD32_10880 [Rhizobium sp. Root483D2]